MILDWLFPPRCRHCRAFLKRDGFLCGPCEAKWPLFQSAIGSSHARVHAAGAYRGVLHELIVRFKYRGKENFAGFLGQKMAERAREAGLAPDVLLPVPLHVSRLRERGYNQSHLLAREVGKRLSIAADPFVLRKRKKTPPQADLPLDERRKNLRDAFEIAAPEKIVDKNVLLIDDVYTTGTTIETLADLLLKKGALRVEALVLARTE